MIKNVKLKKFLVDIIAPGASFANRWIKKKNQIFFYNANDGLRDNSEALFTYLIRHGYNRKYKILTNVPKEEAERLPHVPNVYYTSKRTAALDYMQSRFVFYSFGKLPIFPAPDQRVINLWHGIPLKTIARLSGVSNGREYFFTYVCASSRMYRPIMAKAFGCPASHVCITGEPKTDAMYRKKEESGEKKIVWAPTFRQSSYFGYDDSSVTELLPLVARNEWKDLNEFLKEEKVHVLVKLHGGQNLNGFTQKRYSNLEILSDAVFRGEGRNLYDELSQSDALISDYSSVYLEYLALNRPIGFVIEDFSEYENSRGFVFQHPLKLMPGDKISSKEQLKQFIRDVARGKDLWRGQREKVNAAVNQYCDGRNCERILKIAGVSQP